MLKWSAITVGGLVLLLAAVLAVVPFLLNTAALQAYVVQTVSHSLGRPVRFASMSISGLPLPTIRLRGLQIAEDPAFGPGPFLTVGEGRLGVRLWPLLRGRVEMTDLTLEEPRVELVADRAGRWNVASLGAPAPTTPAPPPREPARSGLPSGGSVLLSRIRIVNGAFHYRPPGSADSPYRLEKVNLVVTQAKAGGELRLNGDALAQPGAVRVTISEATLTPASSRAVTDASLRATLQLDAPDIAPLAGPILAPSSATGPLKGELRVSGTPSRLTAVGTITLPRLVLSEAHRRCGEGKRQQLVIDTVKMPLTYAPGQLDGRPVEASVGRGAITLELGLTLEPTRVATLKDITVKGVELGPVLVDYLCQPYAVTGPLDLTGAARVAVDDPWRTMNGSGRLRVGAGRVVGSDMLRVIEDTLALAGTVSALLEPGRGNRDTRSVLNFDSITATYTVTNGVVRTNDLLYQAADFRARGAGTYALADGRIDMNVTVTQGPNRFKGVLAGSAGSVRIVPTDVKVHEPRDLRKLLDRLLR